MCVKSRIYVALRHRTWREKLFPTWSWNNVCPRHGKKERKHTHFKLVWPRRPTFQSALGSCLLAENLTQPCTSQPRSVSNEERTGSVGPHRVNLAGWRLLGLRVGCLSLCLTSSAQSGSTCLSFSSHSLAFCLLVSSPILPVSHISQWSSSLPISTGTKAN